MLSATRIEGVGLQEIEEDRRRLDVATTPNLEGGYHGQESESVGRGSWLIQPYQRGRDSLTRLSLLFYSLNPTVRHQNA